ncbi:MAG: gliding motility-associated C-terminal domain-containing protein [Bacteroidota bacterium]
MRIYKYLLLTICIILFGSQLMAQIEGKIILLPDNKTYQVSIIPQVTFNAQLSRTNSAQITLLGPTSCFEVTNVMGITGEWGISGFANAPAENSGFDYYSIELTSQWEETYTTGEEIILFTFENGASCTGSISIIDDQTDPFLPPNSQNLNVGNLFTVLGAGPINSYAGSVVPTAPAPEALAATATATLTELACPEDVTSIVVDIQGGAAPFTIIYTNTTTGEVDSLISNQVNTPVEIQNITGGSYNIEIRDSRNASSISSAVINAPEPISFTLNTTAANCATSQDGAVEIMDLNRENATIEWNTGGFDSTPALSGLGPNTYSVTVTDENNCQSTQSATVKMDGWIDPAGEAIDVSCFGMNDGAITMATTGKNFPFTYEWDNGREVGTGDNLTGLTPGDYSITVTDATGVCQEVTTLTVNEPAELSASALVDSSSICELETESIVIVDLVENSRGSVSYSLDGIDFTNNNQFTLDAGEAYTITVLDEAGCEANVDVNVPAPSGLSLELPEDIVLNLGEDLEIESNVDAPTIVNYSWSNAESLSCSDCPNPMANPTRTTTYTLTVSDDNGCVKEGSVIVYLSTTRRVYAPNAFSPNGDGLNDLYTIFTSSDALSLNTLKIYDRWGEKVYESPKGFLPGDEFNFGWDGRFNGQEMPNGVYVYLAEITFIDGKTEVFTGDVTLSR